MSALSTTARHEYYAELGRSLPPPVIDKPEYRERRLTTAVETFEALRPGNAYEASLAVKIVLCSAHAMDGLREAGVHRESFAKMTRCRAQAAGMMREERAAKRTLAQEQKMRLAVEAVAGNAEAQPAAASAPAPQAAPPPVQPQPRRRSPPLATPCPGGPAASCRSHPGRGPRQAALARGDRQRRGLRAQEHGGRGADPSRPRRHATEPGVFPQLTLPTDPAVIDALVRGTSDVLTVLDEVGGEDLDAAA